MESPAPSAGDRYLPVRVQALDGQRFAVTVGDRSRHRVLASEPVLLRVGRAGETPEQTIERAMRFLLEREPPEQILKRFRLEDIAVYFPEFWRSMV